MNKLHIVNVSEYQKEQAARQLLDWLDNRFPGTKNQILTSINSSGLGQETSPAEVEPWYTKVIDAAQQIVPAIAQYKIQKDITDLQIERAKSGQPPLDVSQYTAPPFTIRHTAQSITPQMKTMLWIGAGIIGAIILIPMLTKR